ncbi:MAG: NAD(P)-binding protein [Erythrobacter sp.]|uniref:NAD(P)-binding protein n=1 Tax=Erythrobacter sp. TaxID=1042 RepID=UPI003263FA54
MTSHETDYLVIGAGAVGMAFVDTLLDEDPDCHITILDKHARPGGHWNDAYSFVALHQPSATYGVNSMEMCPDRVDERGHNKGMYPLAKHAEILAYYSSLMTERFVPSGRVTYLPLTEYQGGNKGEHSARSILSGDEHSFTIRRKLVDGTWFKTSVPSTHKPAFDIGEGTRFAPPGDLPFLWMDTNNLPQHYCIIGGGKTAMDTAIWLLEAGVPADKIDWVRPRDSWMFNRKLLQPAYHHIEDLVQFQVDLVECANGSETGDEMFAKLGKRGTMLRIDESVTPKMFHFAVISEAEIALLQQITKIHRNKRVSALETSAMIFGDERTYLPEGTLFIDCTASAVPFEQRDNGRPFFQGDTITLQLAQAPLVPFSAALAAFIEVHFETDDEKNNLVPPAPLTDTTETYPYAVMANLMSTAILSGNEKTNAFNNKSRLHPTGPAIVRMMRENDPRLAALSEIGPKIQANLPGVIKLGMAAKAIHEAA